MEDPNKPPAKQKSPSAAGKYKAMVNSKASDTTQKPGGYDKDGYLLVEKKDGSTGRWGNDIPDIKKPVQKQLSKKPVISDKAAGLTNNYYPAKDQNVGPAIPSIPRSNNY